MPISPPMLVPTQSSVLTGACWLQLRQQGQHVGRVGRHLVAHGVGQPVAAAAPTTSGHTTRSAPPGAPPGLRQHIKVAPLARQAVHAHHHMGLAAGSPHSQ
jgi:hypothetical protein